MRKSPDDPASYVILEDDTKDLIREYYIQTALVPSQLDIDAENYGFVLEYREGSHDSHYQSFPNDLGWEGLRIL